MPSPGIFRSQELKRCLLHCRRILFQLPGKPTRCDLLVLFGGRPNFLEIHNQ